MHSDALGSQLSSQDLYHLHNVQGFLSWCRVSFPSEVFPLCRRDQRFPAWWRVFFPSWDLLPSSPWSGFLSIFRVSLNIPIIHWSGFPFLEHMSFTHEDFPPISYWSGFLSIWKIFYHLPFIRVSFLSWCRFPFHPKSFQLIRASFLSAGFLFHLKNFHASVFPLIRVSFLNAKSISYWSGFLSHLKSFLPCSINESFLGWCKVSFPS